MDTTRKCSKCEMVLPLESFGVDNGNTLGRKYKCRDCERAEYQENREFILERRKKYYRNNGRKPHRPDPQKLKARTAIATAVNTGKLEKPSNCSSCGKGGRIEGHHDDYDKPLSVVWVCPSCHKAIHRKSTDK